VDLESPKLTQHFLGSPDYLVIPAPQKPPGIPVDLVIQMPLEVRLHLEIPDLLDSLEHPETLGRPDCPEFQPILAVPANLDRPELPENR